MEINIKDFASKKHYERFLYALELTNKVNKLIDEGYSLFLDNVRLRKLYVDKEDNSYRIFEQHSKYFTSIWIGGSYKNDKGEQLIETKKEIDSLFNKIVIYQSPKKLSDF